MKFSLILGGSGDPLEYFFENWKLQILDLPDFLKIQKLYQLKFIWGSSWRIKNPIFVTLQQKNFVAQEISSYVLLCVCTSQKLCISSPPPRLYVFIKSNDNVLISVPQLLISPPPPSCVFLHPTPPLCVFLSPHCEFL